MRRLILIFLMSNFWIAKCDVTCAQEVWQIQQTGSQASLRGLCVVDEKVVWASGTEGTVLKTVDSGDTWENVSVDSVNKLDFRDIHAFDQKRAVVLSAGQPARTYLTTDGGESWRMTFEHPDKRSFFDALSFWDTKKGVAMSDPVDGKILLIGTEDGGESWSQWNKSWRPNAERGEAGFAASGTNMVVSEGRCLIALGGGENGQVEKQSRLVYTYDSGMSWMSTNVPMLRDPSSGIFSIAIKGKHGVAVGGNFKDPKRISDNCAISLDKGLTWRKPNGKPPRGYRSCVAFAKNEGKMLVVAVGPTGSDISNDFGNHWEPASDKGFHAVAFTKDGQHGWASGSDGRIVKWVKNQQAIEKSAK